MNNYQYKKLYHIIKKDILTGTYPDGDTLPSENELAYNYKLNRMTVRQALGDLANEGYIVKIKGKGSIVTRKERKSLGVLSVKGFSDVATFARKKVSTKFIQKPILSEWPNDFFHEINYLEKKSKCIYMKRVRMVDDDPVMIESTYIAEISLPGFTQKEFVNGSLFDTLNADYEIEIVNVEQDLRAVTAKQEIKDLLNLTDDLPVLQIYLKFVTNNPTVNIYSSLICDTSKYSISNVLG